MSHVAPAAQRHQVEKQYNTALRGVEEALKFDFPHKDMVPVTVENVREVVLESKPPAQQYELNNTDIMLVLWYNRNLPKPKMKKLCFRLMKRCAPATANGILNRILNAADPTQEIIKAGDEVTEFEAILKAYGDQGYHGVVVHRQVAYPVKFSFEEEAADYQWAIENESMMRVKVAQALMNQLNMKELACEVLLFGTKGFSADYKGVHVAHQCLNRVGVTVTADGMIVE